MTVLLLLLLVVGLSASVTVYRRKWIVAEERGSQMLSRANEFEAEADHWRGHVSWLHSHRLTVANEPEWAYTVSRPYITPTGDRATYSTLEDLIRP